MHETKIYRCELLLGMETDTSDAAGSILCKSSEYPDPAAVHQVLTEFTGEILQTPPMYSAIKIQGRKLYELAREGKEVEIPPRRVSIASLRVLDHVPPNRYFIEVICSKGTYIRSLCRDIGRRLGCGGMMSFLLRCATGGFIIDNAVTLDELAEAHQHQQLDHYIIPMDTALSRQMPPIHLNNRCFDRVIHGNRVSGDELVHSLEGLSPGQPARIYCGDRFIGIGCYREESTGIVIAIKNVLL